MQTGGLRTNLEYALGGKIICEPGKKKWIKITVFKWELHQISWVWNLRSRKSGIDSVSLNSSLRSVFCCSMAILIWFSFTICDTQLEKEVCQLLIAHLEPWSAFVLRSYYTGLQHQDVVDLPPIAAIFWVVFVQREVILVLLMINFWKESDISYI